ncbi:MAG: hypothetical protein AAF745_04695 [Planctomycetota bacterium]
MSKHIFAALLFGLLSATSLTSTASAQAPGDFAENDFEFAAWDRSFSAQLQSGELARRHARSMFGGLTANIDSATRAAFFHSLDALLEDDDTIWLEMIDDLDDAIEGCELLLMWMHGWSRFGTPNTSHIDNLLQALNDARASAVRAEQQSRTFQAVGISTLWGRGR